MCDSRTIKIGQNQDVDFLIFFFTEDSLSRFKDLELVSRSHFFVEVFVINICFVLFTN